MRPAAETDDVEWTATYTGKLKSHLTYAARVGKTGDSHYVRLSCRPPDAAALKAHATITATESEDQLKAKEAILSGPETAERFNAAHGPWAYRISGWSAERLNKPLAELLEPIIPDEPQEPQAKSE